MKLLTTSLFIILSFAVRGQFHVKVACNPDNGGKVDPTWETNYTVFYTLDNWKHSLRISDIEGSYILGDDTKTPMDFYFVPFTFKTMDQAVAYAKQFYSAEFVGIYEAKEYELFLSRMDDLKKRKATPKAVVKTSETECQQKVIY